MASPNSWKLRALLKKNLLILKRNIMSTLCEILFPIILILISYGIRSAFSLKKYDFESVEGSLEGFIKKRSMGSPELPTDLATNTEFEKTETGLNWLGISILPPLTICSELNSHRKARPLIASIGLPDRIINKMITDSEIFKTFINFSLNKNNFKTFKNIEELNNYIKDPKYGQENNQEICFGARLEKIDKKYEYSLHYFDTSIGDGIEDITTVKNGLFDRFQSGPDFDSWDLYQKSSYIYMMKLINEYILQEELNDQNAKINIGISPMKYIDYREDPFSNFIGYMIPFFIIIAYMCPLCLYVYRMVGEKENKSKEGMKIMGLGEGTYFLSYFLQFLVIAIIDTVVNTYILTFLFTKIPFIFIFLIVFLFTMDVFALIFFFQSFIDRTRVAVILSLLVYFVMYFISMACMSEDASPVLKYVLSLFPPVCIELGIILLGKFECHFRKFHLGDYTRTYTNYCIGLMNLVQLVDFFLFLFLGYYLQNVLPHEFGIRRPWYFIFTSEYWCKKDHKNNKKKENNVVEVANKNIENNLQGPIIINDNLENNNNNEIDSQFQRLKQIKKKKKKKKKKMKMKNKILKDKNEINKNFQGEELYKDKTKPDDALRIKNIVKIFGDGKKAVDKVNLNLYKDEIFALLGHNGAGKTTLISMLTGLYEATEGEAMYDGYDILESGNMDKFRCKLGICPQHDVLFDDLTIKEHLEMFCIFKGYSSNIEENVNKTMEDFELSNIQSIVAKNLSAGQRRKLSIAISLIGGSEVIFLDEPSSGMDITSRRNLWEILKRQAERKIIILTTHYMEEASVLGNRIGIINSGQMKCIGTPLFLIERFGKYLSLNVTKEEDADNNKIVEFVQKMAQNVEFEILSEEIIFRIPKSNYTNNDEKLLLENNKKKRKKKDNESNNISISNFFEEFDNNLQNLKIKSYSASMPTLEDVFLNVAAEDNKANKLHRAFSLPRDNDDKILFQTNFKEDFTKKSKFCNDFNACFYRRFLLTKRDVKGFIMEILCPILLCIVGLGVSQVDIRKNSNPQKMNMSYIGKQKILYGKLSEIDNINKYHFENMANITSENLDYGNFNTGNEKKAIQNFIEKIYNDYSKDSEDSINHEVDMMSKNYIGYYGGLLILKNKKDTNDIKFIEVLNARVKHGIPIYTYYFMKKIIEVQVGKEINIDFTHYPLPLTAELEQQSDQSNNNLVVFFVAIAFALIPANFITIIVKEKINNSKHLMRVSGISILAYWIVNFIFELLKYYVTCGICILLLLAFDFYKDYLYILYICYGPSMIILTYLSSFIFDSESSAQNKTILLNFLLGSLGATVILMLRFLDNTRSFAKQLQNILSLLPSFCFNFGFDLLLNKIMIYYADYPNEWFYFKDNILLKKFNLLLGPIIFLCTEFVIYTIILIIIECRAYKSSKISDKKLESNNINDSQVLKEIDIVNDESITVNEKNYAVRIKNLKKSYSMGCCSSKIEAIKNMNFCVEPGECFGLLGLNGAGKTTTFKCLTQEISPDNGRIFINGKDMRNNFNELSNIFGYCPQFDAIFEYMTVYENLEFYAKIKGVKKDLIEKVINAMIQEMSLGEFTNKISGKLSGGNKRKLSVAISFLCNPPIVLLDEPSTGMDPEARRFMWSVIHKISANNSSVIMTTHSMDEAETLCKRMAIMVNGEFVCLGKANHIKEKYGYGYEIDVRIKPLPERVLNETLMNYSFDKKLKIKEDNVKDVLMKLNKNNYIDELKKGRFGSKINRDMIINDGVPISALISWIFYVKNALNFIKSAKCYFEEIILTEHIDNNFLFKIKKGNDTKSIGFLFGIFEKNKDNCNVTEYSIQQTSLEQIFNQFAGKQAKTNGENNDNDREKNKQKEEIVINDDVYNKLLE